VILNPLNEEGKPTQHNRYKQKEKRKKKRSGLYNERQEMRPHRNIGLGITTGGCLRVRVVPASAGMASSISIICNVSG